MRTVFEALISAAVEIEEIDLSYTGLGDASAPLLCTLIEMRSSLQSLGVAVATIVCAFLTYPLPSISPIWPAGLAWNLLSMAWPSIFEAVATTGNLRVLDVSSNRALCDRHINALADCVARNSALRTLDVSGCRLHPCAAPIAEALRDNRALETLMVDNMAAQAIAQHVNTTDDFKCQLAVSYGGKERARQTAASMAFNPGWCFCT